MSAPASSHAQGWEAEAQPGKTQHLASADANPEGLAGSDWTSIRAAYQAHRHQIMPAEGGYRARNPEQHWHTEFDGRGFTSRPEAGDWEWGLELRSYGFPGRKRVIDNEANVTLEGARLSYRRDSVLREWFVNDERGLEHGFTVGERPDAANENKTSLEFDLAVRGSLRPETSTDGNTLSFKDPQGTTVLTYSGLKVWDADGSSLPARFAAQANGVRLVVDERGSHYPITVDPIAQQAYVKASNTAAGDSFGISVAVSGDTVVVGASCERSSATGVNGDQTDNSAPEAGAAYVFVRNGTTWSQQAYLKASNTEIDDQFGLSVAVSGDTVVVAAPAEGSDANGVNGNQADNSAPQAGAAYVFVRNGSTWTQQAYLKASNSDAGDYFGKVAVSGDTVVVGVSAESSNATGINGNQIDNSAALAGAAYVFVRNGTTWSQQAYLKASNTNADDIFGRSVSVSGDTVVVGGPRESSNATGINGDQTDNSATDAGAAYVFARNGATWSQQAYLKASNTGTSDNFGWSVTISGDTVVVGAVTEDSNTTGINGDQTDNSATDAGAAYVFVRNGATWSQQAYLKASNTDAGDAFGSSVAVSGDTAVVVATAEDSNATGINGDQTDNSAQFAGAAYVFVRNGATWSQQAYLKASNTDAGDFFGESVAVSGDTVVVGAARESSSATGVNGDQTNNSAGSAGAAYISTGFGPTPTIPLLNISTRLNVGTGENVLIGGFIVTGTEAKKVILRAIGPSLPISGDPPPLADPILELHKPNNVVITNDNWKDTQKQEIIDSTIPPTNDLESAIVATLVPGPYTAIVRGKNNGTGIGLVEVYDLDQAAKSQLANISTRGFVDIGNNVMIGGFIVGGGISTTVLVRAIGPSLSASAVGNPLQDPTLELHNSNGLLIAFDNDWKDSQQTEIAATGIPPTDDREAGIKATLTPGAYTAIVSGKDNTTGVGLMEVYNLQ